MVAGNWKMNTTVDAGVELARAVAARVAHEESVDVAVIPPFTHLVPVRDALHGSAVRLGAQDVYWENEGAFTGEVSPVMLRGLCDLVLVGHSERRHLLGETDEQTGLKFCAAIAARLQVIVAVGETESERDGGHTMSVVNRQLNAALAAFDTAPDASRWLVAYEPVWAIGTGRTATVEQAQEMCAHIRRHLVDRIGESPRVLYGGSVSADNAPALFAAPDIDGGLIGGASLKPDVFATIVAAAAS